MQLYDRKLIEKDKVYKIYENLTFKLQFILELMSIIQ